jgi:hypothetical protein
MAQTGSACRHLVCAGCTQSKQPVTSALHVLYSPAPAAAPVLPATGETHNTPATELPVEQQYHRKYAGGGHAPVVRTTMPPSPQQMFASLVLVQVDWHLPCTSGKRATIMWCFLSAMRSQEARPSHSKLSQSTHPSTLPLS